MKKKKQPRGPRTPNITILCEWCGEHKETTREDTKTCSGKCRQRLAAFINFTGYPPDSIPGPILASQAIAREVRRLMKAERNRRLAADAERQAYLARPEKYPPLHG